MNAHETTGVAVERMSQEPEEMSGLVRLAIQEKVPVEVLERIVALQERVSAQNARSAFFDALSRFQNDVPPIHKGQKAEIATKSGARYGYTYASLDEIARAIRGPLQENGLSYAWTVEESGGNSLSVVCVLRHIMGHEERSGFPVPVDTAAAMSGAQKHGAALTYGKRQSLTSVLGLTTTDDDVDGADLGRDPGTITEEQAADLRALGDEVGQDWGKFLAWAQIERLEDLPAAKLAQASRTLQAKRGAR